VEREEVRELLNSEPFQDQAPREVYATLLDGGVYCCSWRTMYRILAEHGEVQERRNQLRHPAYARPELLATAPNQLWTWDITKLRGPVRGRYYYLYVIIDVFSRYVVGWMLAEQESASLAQELIAQSCARHGIQPDQLTIHADNGGPMKAKSVAELMADLNVTRSHSRPHVPDDNPFSEAQFKTLKYNPAFPKEFESLAAARQWSDAFFHWYNHEHHHTGISLFTPATVHSGQVAEVQAQRQAAMQRAYAAHPERFVKGAPVLPPLPTAVWINRPPQPGAPIASPTAGAADHVILSTPVEEDKAPLESDLSASLVTV
jgi:putative transposase